MRRQCKAALARGLIITLRLRDGRAREPGLSAARLAPHGLIEIGERAAQQSYLLLQRTLQQSPTLTPDLQQRTKGLLADMDARRGDGAAAERHYRAALAAR